MEYATLATGSPADSLPATQDHYCQHTMY